MSKKIIQLLNDIEISLNNLNHSCLSYLNRGISFPEIQEQFSKISLRPNEELITLFSWRNGTKVTDNINLGDLAFFPGFYLMSLQESISTYIELRDTFSWKKSWFPIFANGGGDFYVVDLGVEAQGKIIGFYVYEEDHAIEYNSLESMLKTLKECYEEGIIFRDNQGYLDMDYYQYAAVAHRINPNLQIWINMLNDKP
ncbi:SMI1/KNR4 family protein [Aggregatibacter actinomycetemcomitans]|uniref:SMI1/KNR4 family protein n=1 Tax=Aggregatibacter actinomycetemcomitans TaxID=714 RepID=UPI00197CA8FE|nr:SMI1/KNR4 family protein [Aggregatibacter actinomycetemcomitans]MBN6077123.1 SMI1/KNR4 family protein [Aggregatibacter actinomycetemcomitans]